MNFLLVGLIEKHKVERPEKICMSCERIDVNKKSEAISVCIDCSDTLCSICLECHRINKSSSNHEIVDISRQGIVLNSFKNLCSEHKSKELELFCVDHNLPCCATCVSVTHRKCEKVLTIEDAASRFRETNSEDKTKNDVSDLLADIDIVIHLEKESLKNLETRNTSQMKIYNDFWANVQKKVDAIKQNQTKQYQNHFEEEKSKLKSSITDLENKKKTVANTKQILDVTIREASNVQVMIEVQKVKTQIDQNVLMLPRNLTFCEINFQLKKNVDEVDKILEKICELNSTKISKTLELSSFRDENPSSHSSRSDSESLLKFLKFNNKSDKYMKLSKRPIKKRRSRGADLEITEYDDPKTMGSYESRATESYILHATEDYSHQQTRTDIREVTDIEKRQAPGTHKKQTTGIKTRPTIETHSKPVTESYIKPVEEPYSKPVIETYSMPVTETNSKPVKETHTKPVTETNSKAVKETHNMPVTETYNKPVKETSTKTVTETYNKPVKETQSIPGTETYSKQVKETYTKPVTDIYNKPVKETHTKPMTEIYSKPVKETFTKLVTETYNKVVEETHTKPGTEAYSNPVKDTSTKPVTETYGKLLKEMNSRPPTGPQHRQAKEIDGTNKRLSAEQGFWHILRKDNI
ncbi:Hypothetical predicted protein [Mytilus galloprovincialis]|uniref:B box-type domain-containing protein n=1 Tax=Mytilus galloprovincialis TaxID=29158 RepID=A0A8B6GQK7_MYTGA|nr:Hypothetical predicted protein [Mytilus galloprovincialis]